MKSSFILTALLVAQVVVFITLPAHAGGVYALTDGKATYDNDSDVQALVEYEEQMAERSAQLEAIAILLQAEQLEALQLEQAKVSNSSEKSSTQLSGQKSKTRSLIGESNSVKSLDSESSTAF